MAGRLLLPTSVLLVLLALLTPAAALFEYSEDAEDGPSNWYQNFPECAGRSQSPIDINDASAERLSAEFMKIWAPVLPSSSLTLQNNNHTVMLTVSPLQIRVGSSTFPDLMDAMQFHFHTPSEHTINGRSYDMELHLVTNTTNRNLIGARAPIVVIAVLFQVSNQSSPLLAQLVEPLQAVTSSLAVSTSQIVPELPDWGTEFWEYSGSLTTPPCTEVVHWVVSTKILNATADQIKAFSNIMGSNNRPVQGLYGREITRRVLAPQDLSEFTPTSTTSCSSSCSTCSTSACSQGSSPSTVLNFAGMFQGMKCNCP